MASDTLIIVIMTMLLGGGPGNDLLGLIPSDSYWKAKDEQVTSANMMLELNSVKADDTTKATAVRRLMAIRALGELKDPGAINSLTTQLDSKEMFVADYAQRALDTIQGKPPKPAVMLSADAMKKDLYMLPEHCGGVGQIRFMPGSPLDLKKLLPQNPDDATAADQKTKVDDFVTQLIGVAELTGNIRADSVTLGVSDMIGPNEGFLVLMVRGQYDHKATIEAVKTSMAQTKAVGDIEFQTADDYAVTGPSDDLFILTSGPKAGGIPFDEIAAAVKDGKGKIESSTELMDVIKTIDITAPAWVAMTISDSYKMAPPLAPLTSLKMVGKSTDHGMTFTASGTGTDADGVKSATDAFTALVNEGKGEVTHQAEQNPMYQSLADLVNSIEVKADGTTMTATGTMKKMGQ